MGASWLEEFAEVLNQIEGYTVAVGGQYASGQCPLHRDEQESLVVAPAQPGCLKVQCMSRGCSSVMIVKELKSRAAGNPKGQYGQDWDGRMVPVEELSYREKDGTIVATERLSLAQARELATRSGLPGKLGVKLERVAEEWEEWDGTPVPIEDLSYRPDFGVMATGSIPIDSAAAAAVSGVNPPGDGYAGYFTSIPPGWTPSVDTLTFEQLKEKIDQYKRKRSDEEMLALAKSLTGNGGTVTGIITQPRGYHARAAGRELGLTTAPNGPGGVLSDPAKADSLYNLERYRMHRRTPEDHDAWKKAVDQIIDGLKANTPVGTIDGPKPEPIHFPDAVVKADYIEGPTFVLPTTPMTREQAADFLLRS